MEHPTVPTPQQPDPRKLRKCSEFLDSGEWAIQDSNLGPLPYQENLLSPPVPQLALIPANRATARSGRGLEGTGRDNLVAPSWPHGSRSRAWRRMTRKRTSSRRDGQAGRSGAGRARLHDRVDRRGASPLLGSSIMAVVSMAGRVRAASPQRPPRRLDGLASLRPATWPGCEEAGAAVGWWQANR